jgi:uncharacterized protein involved in copper resistance
MTRARRTAHVASCAAVLALVGCGLDYPDPEQPQPSSAPARTRPAPPRQADPRSAREAIERFAAVWTRADASITPLLELAAGSLRAQLALGRLRPPPRGASTGAGSSTRETLEGVMVRPARSALVITRISTRFDAGGTQSSYAVYVASARRAGAVWRVVSWEPTG